MEEKLVSYEVAKLAKEVGFNVVTEYRFFYNSELTTKTPSQSSKPTIYAPTQSLLQKWIREVYNIHIEIQPIFQDDILFGYNTFVYDTINERIRLELEELNKPIHCDYKTYEQALEQALLESLKLIKDEKI